MKEGQSKAARRAQLPLHCLLRLRLESRGSERQTVMAARGIQQNTQPQQRIESATLPGLPAASKVPIRTGGEYKGSLKEPGVQQADKGMIRTVSSNLDIEVPALSSICQVSLFSLVTST